MLNRKRNRISKVALAVVVLFFACGALFAQHKRQMRAAWIATVANIDWPQRGCYDVERQQNSMIAILDSLKSLNFNAVIFQIRPTSDAFYSSEYEPWSRYLTGQQGVAPDPYYDPLAFVIHEAHTRQIEVHVWLNPYRVLNVDNLKLLSYNHIYFRHPELVVRYGGQYYFNPALYQTRMHLIDVVSDVLRRYDVDAVHFDDYFYPYPVNGLEFPDVESFRKFPRGFDNIADWRRNNVDLIIEELSKTIKAMKPWVQFGISPFGVWRNDDVDPRGSATRAGTTNYDHLYADVLKWIDNGWIDYVVPQLYWERGFKVADYDTLLTWWSDNTTKGNLYVGVTASKLNDAKSGAWQRPNEICRQLKQNDTEERVNGVSFFSTKTLLENRQGLCDSLRHNYFRYPAIIPANDNMRGGVSDTPGDLRIERLGRRDYLLWNEVFDAGGYEVFYYVVYRFKAGSAVDLSNPDNILALSNDNLLDLSQYEDRISDGDMFVVTTVNRYHYESEPSNMVEIKIRK